MPYFLIGAILLYNFFCFMLFITLLYKLLPLYFLIILWYISGKALWVKKESVATLLIYIIAPVVIFYWVYRAELSIETLSIPFLFYILASLIGACFYFIWNIFYPEDSTKNILSFTSGTGNTWYFWLPVISILLWPEYFSLAVLAILGFVLYENTLWFYMTAKWSFSTKESLKKVMKLPTIYAFLGGIIANVYWIDFNIEMIAVFDNFIWAYSVLWIMIVGMWLMKISVSTIDFTFLWLTFLAKFIVWPVLTGVVIFLDSTFFSFYSESAYSLFIIISIVPLASNTIALASELKVYPEKAAMAVLASTLFALVYIPIVTSIFL